MTADPVAKPGHHHRRFLDEQHLPRPFGPGSFGEKAEAFARFFGTPGS